MDVEAYLKDKYKKLKSILDKFNHRFPIPSYRLVSIEKDSNDEFIAVIQLMGRDAIFRMKPEEVLSKDDMTDKFLPRDIRTLTYLGYLGINAPKYRILAQKLSETNDQMIFAINKKGSEAVDIKTAGEISSNDEIINNLSQRDAHTVGYISATENMLFERNEMKRLRENSQEKLKSGTD